MVGSRSKEPRFWESMAKNQANIRDFGLTVTLAGLLSTKSLLDLMTVASDDGDVTYGVLSYSEARPIIGKCTLIVRQGDQLHDVFRDYVINGISKQ